ncbi:uncharacterized protein PB18E9.04c [Silurus meridionalis]|uniref:MANSC domain-containing protein n=1 Tax=Silurus meridionalis TaxID=175797 RepID=A0A8T0BQZ6_SILME|nr:uncharacterized protein PB18E9.04c [Silurus meridionalis]XP_046705698.1 uncharacterized protein PB18E9.04c [Silurus meridionalis]KAF7707770.1 hypothetical protein HF521_018988 [Silurus meridionalis]
MIMKLHHVVQVLLWSVCVCDVSSMVKIVANQTTPNPENCIVSKCPVVPGSCNRAIFSEKDSTCIFLSCDDNTTCDLFLKELGEKLQNEEARADPPHPSSDSLESPVSPTQSAPSASLSASAAPVSHPGPPPAADSNSSDASAGRKTRTFTRSANLGQVLNKTLQHEDQNKTLYNGHQGQPSATPSAPTPTSPPLPVASVGAGNISLTVPKDQNKKVNKTDQHSTTTSITTSITTSTSLSTSTPTSLSTTTSTSLHHHPTSISTSLHHHPTSLSTTTSSAKPVLSSNSTTVTTITIATVTPTTTNTTTPTTTNKVTSLQSETQTQPTSSTPSPPPTHPPSTAPPFLPSVTPSTPPPPQTNTTTTPRVADVTSDQDKAKVQTAGGELVGHVVNTSSLIAVLIFGLLFFIVTVILFLRHAYESYKRRGYTQMDYLINGMYADSGL